MSTGTFLNLGINVGMNPKGFMAGLKQLTQGLTNAASPKKGIGSQILDTVQGQAKTAKNMLESINLGNMLKAFPVTNNAMNTANHLITQGGELTTSYEAQVFQTARTAKMAAMGMSNSSKVQQKVTDEMTNMSISMNIGIDKIAKAYQELAGTHSEDILKGMGLNLKDLLKISEVTGAPAADLIDTFAKMNQELGMSPAAIKKMTDSMAYVGRDFGMGNEAVAQLPELIKAGGDVFAKFAKQSPEQAQKILTSTFALEAGYRRMGLSASEASQAAQSSMKLQMGEQQTVERMFTGLTTNLGEFTKNLGIGQGDIEKTFKDLKKNPAEFAQSMIKMYKDANKAGKTTVTMDQFLQNVGDAVPELKMLITHADKAQAGVTDALKGMEDASGKTTGAFKKTTEAWNDGRTAADKYKFTLDQFNARIRTNGTSSWEYASLMSEGYKNLGDKIQKVVKKGGPMSELVKETMDLEKFGPKALFPKVFWTQLDQMGTLVPKFEKFAVVWKQMGFSFSSLFGPAGAIVAGAAVFGAHWSNLIDGVMASAKKAGKSIDFMTAARATFDKALADVKIWAHKGLAEARKWIAWIGDKLSKINWEALFSDALDGVRNFMLSFFGFQDDTSTIAGDLGKTLHNAIWMIVANAGSLLKGAGAAFLGTLGKIWDDEKTPLLGKVAEIGGVVAATLWGASIIVPGGARSAIAKTASLMFGGIGKLVFDSAIPFDPRSGIGAYVSSNLTALGTSLKDAAGTFLGKAGLVGAVGFAAYEITRMAMEASGADAAIQKFAANTVKASEDKADQEALVSNKSMDMWEGAFKKLEKGTLNIKNITELQRQYSSMSEDTRDIFKQKLKGLGHDMPTVDVRNMLGSQASLQDSMSIPLQPLENLGHERPMKSVPQAMSAAPVIKNITVNTSPDMLAKEEALVDKQIQKAKDNTTELADLLSRQNELLEAIAAQGGKVPVHKHKAKAITGGAKGL